MVAVVKAGHLSSKEAEGFILTALRNSGVGRHAQSYEACVQIIVSGSQYDDKEQTKVMYSAMHQLIRHKRVTETPALRYGHIAKRFTAC